MVALSASHWDLPPSATSAPGLGSRLPHLDLDLARPCHFAAGNGHLHCNIYTGTGQPLPHLHRDWARPLPHLHRDSAHSCNICTGTRLTPAATSVPGLGLAPATSAPGLSSPLPHLQAAVMENVPAHGTPVEHSTCTPVRCELNKQLTFPARSPARCKRELIGSSLKRGTCLAAPWPTH